MKIIDPIEAALLSKFLTIPYLPGGRSLQGADCLGGMILWFRMRLGIEIPDVQGDYPNDQEWQKNFIENYHQDWTKINAIVPSTYDVIIFNCTGELHCGVYIRQGRFYHISRAGSSLGNLDLPYWSQKVEGFYRNKAINDSNHQIHSERTVQRR